MSYNSKSYLQNNKSEKKMTQPGMLQYGTQQCTSTQGNKEERNQSNHFHRKCVFGVGAVLPGLNTAREEWPPLKELLLGTPFVPAGHSLCPASAASLKSQGWAEASCGIRD